MKYSKIITLSGIAVLSLTACHREKFYTCVCRSTDTTAIYMLGRTSADNAYGQCRSFSDSATTCIMEIRK